MPDLQSLIQAAQAAGVGGQGSPAPTSMAPGGSDVIAQLQALLSQGAATGMQPQTNVSSGANGVPQRNNPNPMLAALNMRAPSGSDLVAGPQSGRSSPATDSDFSEVDEANQGVRGNLPMYPDRDYSDTAPYGNKDPRQTPMPMNQGDPSQWRGQQNMGAYLDANNKKPLTTEEELADVSRRMGGVEGKSGDPSEDGNFPTSAEIKALQDGKIDPGEFDAKWGRGAAKEMMTQDKDDGPDDDNDDGDHEYR